MTSGQRRVGVFIDYWWVYSSARQVFPGPETPSPSWFGNVSPAALARTLVKRPPAAARRSERSLAGLHIFVRHYDLEMHRSQHERVLRWRAEAAEVHVGPSREASGAFWQTTMDVDLACTVALALERREYDQAIVFAGDAALLPLFTHVAARDPGRIELATWIAPDGTVPTTLPGVNGVWCHRLGEASFNQVTDDRRLARNQPPGHALAPRSARSAGDPAHLRAPGTSMAAAFAAAGLDGRASSDTASMPPAASAEEVADSPGDADAGGPAGPAHHGDDHRDGSHRVAHRLTQRIFGHDG